MESAENIWIRFIPVWCGSPSSAIGRFRFASVLGREFRLDVLARVGAFDEDELLDALEAAQRAGLIRAAQELTPVGIASAIEIFGRLPTDSARWSQKWF